MATKSKPKLLFITITLTLMLTSSVCTIIVPCAHATQLTSVQKGETISKDVIGLDLTKYTKTIQEAPSDSYLDMLPQESVRYTLESNGNKVDVKYTFTNGNLRILHVLETEGSPLLTKTAKGTLANAKDFLNSYQQYTGKSLYSELSAMLNTVDVGKNSTITYGNTKLETTTSDNYETFRWTYTYNGLEAPSKCVSIGYENGFLKYFFDTWDLYTIGSTDVNISETESISMAMDNAGNFSWKMGEGDGAYEVQNFTVAQAMVTQTVLSNFIYPDKARNNNPLTLYPMRCMWVSLDKFYPGNVYGIEVCIWADTKEIGDIKERFSTLDPPVEQVASLDDYAIEPIDSQGSYNDGTKLNVTSIPWALPTLAATMSIAIAWLLFSRKKKLTYRRFFKVGEALLCLLLSVTMLLIPIAAVNATSTKGRAEIWGAESTGGYDPDIPTPWWKYWRKTYNEIQRQKGTSMLINNYFNENGYDSDNNQGSKSLKQYILRDISFNEANYPRSAIVDFDHGVGRTDYVQGEWHYLFEDNVGVFIGESQGPNDPPLSMHHEHAVYDMDVYPRTAGVEPMFAFINTCLSANIDSQQEGYITSTQGLVPGTDRARGLPFAWCHRLVKYKHNAGFNTAYHMSDDGYGLADGGDFCYMGFPRGSAALDQIITMDSHDVPYCAWVESFFEHALTEDLSVKQAMNEASLDCWTGRPFSQTPLCNGFTAVWPMWLWNSTTQVFEWQDQTWDPPGSDKLVVYGNGNIHLYQKGGIWHFDGNAEDDLHENDGDIHGASWTYPKFGTMALHFDGSDDYMRVNHDAQGSTLNFGTGSFTFEAWIRWSGFIGGDYDRLVVKSNYPSQWWCIDIAPNGAVEFESNIGTVTWGGGALLETNKWVHLAIVVDRKNNIFNLYKNGKLHHTESKSWSGSPDSSADIYFAPNHDFHGAIDEVRIYDYALSAGQIADNAAVASLHCNGGDYAYDSSPYGNTGTLYGASWATGLRTSSGYSYGLSFGSDDYVEVPSSSSLRIRNAITISAWIKIARKSGDSSDQIIVSKNGFDYILNVYGTGRGANVGKVEVGGSALSPSWLVGSTVVDDDKWHNIVFTYDGSYKMIYVDGYPNTYPTATSGLFASTSGPLRIGRQPAGDRQVNGIIDEVKIYDRALSQSEIYNYYVANKPVYWLEVNAPYSQATPVAIYIDDQLAGYTSAALGVTRGSHTVEVSDWYYIYPYYYVFDHFGYDGTTNPNNPMTLTVSKDTVVTAYYVRYG